ncbi:MAG: toll/interleukin-1 receptor domain-containing protein, partial [Verrucomicrobia bacterium]|nr:toll/interleukin-1 receptor domain-containing protein [Verrucomicrobiota bacterium]
MSEAGKAVFLSYASQDAEAALRLCSGLRAAGVEVWFDQNEPLDLLGAHGLVGGDAWDAKIRKQIAECALFVPVISANTQARGEGYFRIEWRLAAQRTHAMAEDQAFLLPVVIDETCDAEARVPGEFKAVQWSRIGSADSLGAFCARVQTLLGGPDPATVGAALRRDGSDESRRKAAPTVGRSPSRPWLWPATLSALALVALAMWRPWVGSTTQPRSAAGASSQTSAAPISAAGRLVAKAWEQMDKTEMARNE